MSASGHTRRFHDVRRMSGLAPTADISGDTLHYAFGPIAEATPTKQGRRLPDRQYCVAVPIRRQTENSFSFPLLSSA
jgi:hypothetical protein